jgi:guanylate kinase
MIIVISGPGGVGKGTVVRELVARDHRLWLSRSWTTRDPRPGEADEAYVFVDRDAFEVHASRDGFLEWAEFLGDLYGTPVPEVGDERDLLLEIDVQGAAQVVGRHPEALFVLLMAPSNDEQRLRLEARGDRPDQVDSRVAKAAEEVAAARQLGAIEVINDDLGSTVAHLESLIADRRRPSEASG